MIDGDLVSYYKSYTDRLDDVVDAICDEITKLQNENMQFVQLQMIMGYCKSLIKKDIESIEKTGSILEQLDQKLKNIWE